MVRYRYNTQVDPPAPFVHVTITNPEREEGIADLPAQVDTAADMTVIPAAIVERLGLLPVEDIPIAGFGAHVVDCPAYFVDVAPRRLAAVSVKALGSPNEPYILLGRDVLNHFQLMLDGPNGVLDIA